MLPAFVFLLSKARVIYHRALYIQLIQGFHYTRCLYKWYSMEKLRDMHVVAWVVVATAEATASHNLGIPSCSKGGASGAQWAELQHRRKLWRKGADKVCSPS